MIGLYVLDDIMAQKNQMQQAPQEETKAIEDRFNSFYQANKTKLLLSIGAVIAVVAICIVYTQQSADSEAAAWDALSSFQTKLMSTPTVDQVNIDSLLEVVSGTDAEPWTFLYLFSYYFNERQIDSASRMLDELTNNFSSHYISKNLLLINKTKQLMESEKTWRNQS